MQRLVRYVLLAVFVAVFVLGGGVLAIYVTSLARDWGWGPTASDMVFLFVWCIIQIPGLLLVGLFVRSKRGWNIRAQHEAENYARLVSWARAIKEYTLYARLPLMALTFIKNLSPGLWIAATAICVVSAGVSYYYLDLTLTRALVIMFAPLWCALLVVAPVLLLVLLAAVASLISRHNK